MSNNRFNQPSEEFYDALETVSSPSTNLELTASVHNLRDEVRQMKQDIATLDKNAVDIDAEISDDIQYLRHEIESLRCELDVVRKDLTNLCTCKCKCDQIQKSVSVENTIAQNRIWRLYSNNFHQNMFFKNSNLLTQFSLLDSRR